MKGVQERTLGILELLAKHSEGLELVAIANALNIPRSAVHRLLSDLVISGYVRQIREHGDYLLTTKLISIGLSFLSNSGVVDARAKSHWNFQLRGRGEIDLIQTDAIFCQHLQAR